MVRKGKYSIAEWLLFGVVVFFVVGYILFPLLQLFREGAGVLKEHRSVFSKNTISAVTNSLVLSVISVVGSALIGTYIAYILHFHKFRYKTIFATIVLLPIALPPIMGTVSFLFLLGENGLLARLLSLHAFRFDGWNAIIIIHLFSFYPLFYVFANAALKKFDYNTAEASYLLGASATQTLWKIVVPFLLPSLVSAALLTFMTSMASFSAPFLFGQSSRFLTTEIYYAKVNGDISYSAALAGILVLFSSVVLFLFRAYRKKTTVETKTKGASRIAINFSLKRSNYGSFVLLSLFSLLVLLPVLALLLLAFLPEGALMQGSLDLRLTFENFRSLFAEPALSTPFFNSVLLSVIAVIATVVLGTVAAYVIRGRKGKVGGAIETLISLPYGVPGTVLALCLILSFNQRNVFSFFNVLVGSLWILPLAYTIRNIPIATQSVITGFNSIDPSYEEASFVLGVGKWRTFRRVTLPLLVPFLVEGTLLVFINSIGEFVATILLYNYDTRTLAVEIYSQLRQYNNGLAAAYGVLMFLIILLVVFVSRRLQRQKV